MIAGRILLKVFLVLFSIAAPLRAAPRTGSFEVSAGGGLAVWVDGRREWLAMVGVTFPFDRAARPPRLVDAAPIREGKARSEKAKSDDEVELVKEPSREVVEFRPSPPRLNLALARATLRAAFRAAGRAEAAERFASLASRVKASAALPELRLRAARTTDQSLRLAPTMTDPYRYTQSGGVSVALEAMATWKLDRLVFADEEIRVEHLRRLRARQDRELAERVLRALFAWQRALSEAERPELLPEERASAELRVLEHALELDMLTGGWFGERVARFGASE